MLTDCDFYFRWKWMRYRRLSIAMVKLNLTAREVKRAMMVLANTIPDARLAAERFYMTLKKISRPLDK